jgi:hypothetical protein
VLVYPGRVTPEPVVYPGLTLVAGAFFASDPCLSEMLPLSTLSPAVGRLAGTPPVVDISMVDAYFKVEVCTPIFLGEASK